MDLYALISVSVLSGIALVGMLVKMKTGFGPYNLRAFGIVLLSSFAAVLVIVKPSVQSAAVAILGAIAGYLFSSRDTREKEYGRSAETKSDGAEDALRPM